MANQPPTTDAEFKFVAHPFRIRMGDVLWYVVWVGGYALAAYEVHDRFAAPAFVLLAGLSWPFKRLWSLVRGEVSREQADWLVGRVAGGDRRASARRRITYDTSNRL